MPGALRTSLSLIRSHSCITFATSGGETEAKGDRVACPGHTLIKDRTRGAIAPHRRRARGLRLDALSPPCCSRAGAGASPHGSRQPGLNPSDPLFTLSDPQWVPEPPWALTLYGGARSAARKDRTTASDRGHSRALVNCAMNTSAVFPRARSQSLGRWEGGGEGP